MAWLRMGPKPISKPMLGYRQLNRQEHLMKFELESIIFIQENAFEIVVCQNGGHFVKGCEF